MKLQKTKLGFTLIELLVVITIIGILATWAVNVYTSQIQKARDTTRITDIKALQSWVEQFYQDGWVYPSKSLASFGWVTIYLPKLPQDPKTWQASTASVFDYMYNVWLDWNGILAQEYEVSTNFEQVGNIASKAATDWWDDDARLEQGVDVFSNATAVVLPAWLGAATALYDCFTPAWAASATCADWDDNPMLIKNN